MQALRCGDGVSIQMIFDGTSKREPSGNFLGILFIPPHGDYQWHAVNGDWGECDTEQEALRELKEAWTR